MRLDNILKDKWVLAILSITFFIFVVTFINDQNRTLPHEITQSLPAEISQSLPISDKEDKSQEEQETLTEEKESQMSGSDTKSEPPLESESQAGAEPQAQPEPEPEPKPEVNPCVNISCSDCQYCSAGSCINYCQGIDTDCGCKTCFDCDKSDGWFNASLSYSCCGSERICSCQQKEYRDYFCFEHSCGYSVTETEIIKSDCIACGTTQTCLEGKCQIVSEPIESPEPSEPSVPPEGIICSTDTYNCSDFATQAEAQQVYNFCGGVNNDIHRLDRDKDGEPCESLP